MSATPRKPRDRDAIVCFGEALVDLLAQPPASPGAPRQFVEYAGGAPANVAVAAARLTQRCSVIWSRIQLRRAIALSLRRIG